MLIKEERLMMVMSFVGGVLTPIQTLILPAILHIMVQVLFLKENSGKFNIFFLMDFVLIVFGIFLCMFSIMHLIEIANEKPPIIDIHVKQHI